MKKMILFAAIMAVMIVGMPAYGQAEMQEVELNEPCSETDFPSTADFLRGHGVGTDRNQQFSIEKARAHALNELASQIAVEVDAVMSMTDESWDMNETSNYAGHALQEIKTAAKQTTGYTIVCKKTVSYMQNNVKMMKTYMVVEIAKEKMIKTAYDVLEKDPNVKLDQSYDEFKKTFDEQINK